jgi:hypothetical protein
MQAGGYWFEVKDGAEVDIMLSYLHGSDSTLYTEGMLVEMHMGS